MAQSVTGTSHHQHALDAALYGPVAGNAASTAVDRPWACTGCCLRFADELSLRRHVRERCIPIPDQILPLPRPEVPFRTATETQALLRHATAKGLLVKRRLTGVLPAAGISAVQKSLQWMCAPMGWATYVVENCRLVSPVAGRPPSTPRSPRSLDAYADQLCQVLTAAASSGLLNDSGLGIVSHRVLLRLSVLRRLVLMLDTMQTRTRPPRPVSAGSRYMLLVALWKFVHFLRATTASNRRHELDPAASFLTASKMRMCSEKQKERRARNQAKCLEEVALSVGQLRHLSKALTKELRAPPSPKTIGACVRWTSCLVTGFFVFWMPPR